jgi:hypothetical protein
MFGGFGSHFRQQVYGGLNNPDDWRNRQQLNQFLYSGQEGRAAAISAPSIPIFTGQLFGINLNVVIDPNPTIHDVFSKNQAVTNTTQISTNDDSELKKHFDFRICRILYDDYKNMTDDQIVQHFKTHGINEQRIVRFDGGSFDPIMYRYLNDDLINMTDDEATKHYIFHGRNEDRFTTLSSRFDPVRYKSLNPDLAHMTDQEARYHYAQYGRKENRAK